MPCWAGPCGSIRVGTHICNDEQLGPLLFENKCAPVEASLLRELADNLMEYGINRLDDAYYLFRKAATSQQASLLHLIQ